MTSTPGYQSERINLQVFVRVRPFIHNDADPDSPEAEDGDPGIVCSSTSVRLRGDREGRCFDGVFGPSVGQGSVFEHVGRHGVDHVMHGYHSTLLLYGQTGSGKTYTAANGSGSAAITPQSGLVPRCVRAVFDCIAGDPGHEYRVSLEWIQLYNDTVHDLLAVPLQADSASLPLSAPLQIRECPDNGVFLVGAKSVTLEKPEDFAVVAQVAEKGRITALTRMNAKSSRSHSCLMVTVARRRKMTLCDHAALKGTTLGDAHRHVLRGRLCVVDLAGSERLKKSGSEGLRKVEARAINTSLAALGNVLQALVDKTQRHVPYRDSKLTRLLQDSLGGTGIATFVVTLAPSERHLFESKNTLIFAERAREVRNAPVVHREVDSHARYAEMQASYEDKLAALEHANRRLASQLQETTSRLRQLGHTVEAGDGHDSDSSGSSQPSSRRAKVHTLYALLAQREGDIEDLREKNLQLSADLRERSVADHSLMAERAEQDEATDRHLAALQEQLFALSLDMSGGARMLESAEATARYKLELAAAERVSDLSTHLAHVFAAAAQRAQRQSERLSHRVSQVETAAARERSQRAGIEEDYNLLHERFVAATCGRHTVDMAHQVAAAEAQARQRVSSSESAEWGALVGSCGAALLQHGLQHSRGEVGALQRRVAEADAEGAVLRKRLAAVAAELDRAARQRTMDHHSTEVATDALRDEAERLRLTESAAQAEIVSLREEVATLRLSNAQADAEIISLTARGDSVCEEAAHIENALHADLTAADALVSTLKREVSQLQHQVALQTAKVEAQSAELLSAKDLLDESDSGIAQLNEALVRAASANDESAQRCAALQRQAHAATASLEIMSQAHAALWSDTESARRAQLAAEEDAARAFLAAAQCRTQHAAAAAAWAAEAQGHRQQASAADTQAQQDATRLSEHRAHAGQLQDDLAEATLLLGETERRLAHSEAALQQTCAKLQAAEQDVDDLAQRHATLQAHTTEQLRDVQPHLAQLAQHLQEKSDEAERCCAERDTLVCKLGEAESALEGWVTRLLALSREMHLPPSGGLDATVDHLRHAYTSLRGAHAESLGTLDAALQCAADLAGLDSEGDGVDLECCLAAVGTDLAAARADAVAAQEAAGQAEQELRDVSQECDRLREGAEGYQQGLQHILQVAGGGPSAGTAHALRQEAAVAVEAQRAALQRAEGGAADLAAECALLREQQEAALQCESEACLGLRAAEVQQAEAAARHALEADAFGCSVGTALALGQAECALLRCDLVLACEEAAGTAAAVSELVREVQVPEEEGRAGALSAVCAAVRSMREEGAACRAEAQRLQAVVVSAETSADVARQEAAEAELAADAVQEDLAAAHLMAQELSAELDSLRAAAAETAAAAEQQGQTLAAVADVLGVASDEAQDACAVANAAAGLVHALQDAKVQIRGGHDALQAQSLAADLLHLACEETDARQAAEAAASTEAQALDHLVRAALPQVPLGFRAAIDALEADLAPAVQVPWVSGGDTASFVQAAAAAVRSMREEGAACRAEAQRLQAAVVSAEAAAAKASEEHTQAVRAAAAAQEVHTRQQESTQQQTAQLDTAAREAACLRSEVSFLQSEGQRLQVSLMVSEAAVGKLRGEAEQMGSELEMMHQQLQAQRTAHEVHVSQAAEAGHLQEEIGRLGAALHSHDSHLADEQAARLAAQREVEKLRAELGTSQVQHVVGTEAAARCSLEADAVATVACILQAASLFVAREVQVPEEEGWAGALSAVCAAVRSMREEGAACRAEAQRLQAVVVSAETSADVARQEAAEAELAADAVQEDLAAAHLMAQELSAELDSLRAAAAETAAAAEQQGQTLAAVADVLGVASDEAQDACAVATAAAGLVRALQDARVQMCAAEAQLLADQEVSARHALHAAACTEVSHCTALFAQQAASAASRLHGEAVATSTTVMSQLAAALPQTCTSPGLKSFVQAAAAAVRSMREEGAACRAEAQRLQAVVVSAEAAAAKASEEHTQAVRAAAAAQEVHTRQHEESRQRLRAVAVAAEAAAGGAQQEAARLRGSTAAAQHRTDEMETTLRMLISTLHAGSIDDNLVEAAHTAAAHAQSHRTQLASCLQITLLEGAPPTDIDTAIADVVSTLRMEVAECTSQRDTALQECRRLASTASEAQARHTSAECTAASHGSALCRVSEVLGHTQGGAAEGLADRAIEAAEAAQRTLQDGASAQHLLRGILGTGHTAQITAHTQLSAEWDDVVEMVAAACGTHTTGPAPVQAVADIECSARSRLTAAASSSLAALAAGWAAGRLAELDTAQTAARHALHSEWHTGLAALWQAAMASQDAASLEGALQDTDAQNAELVTLLERQGEALRLSRAEAQHLAEQVDGMSRNRGALRRGVERCTAFARERDARARSLEQQLATPPAPASHAASQCAPHTRSAATQCLPTRRRYTESSAQTTQDTTPELRRQLQEEREAREQLDTAYRQLCGQRQHTARLWGEAARRRCEAADRVERLVESTGGSAAGGDDAASAEDEECDGETAQPDALHTPQSAPGELRSCRRCGTLMQRCAALEAQKNKALVFWTFADQRRAAAQESIRSLVDDSPAGDGLQATLQQSFSTSSGISGISSVGLSPQGAAVEQSPAGSPFSAWPSTGRPVRATSPDLTPPGGKRRSAGKGSTGRRSRSGPAGQRRRDSPAGSGRVSPLQPRHLAY